MLGAVTQPAAPDSPRTPGRALPESVQRLLDAAAATTGRDQWVLLTYAAREWGALGHPQRAHALLDELEVASRGTTDPEVLARLALERAWLLLDEGTEDATERAATHARDAAALTAAHLDETPLGGLHVEASRLLARAADDPREQSAMLRKAIALAGSSGDPEARAWRARLLIDLGRAHYLEARIGPARMRLNEAIAAAIETGDDDARDEAARLVAWIEDDLAAQVAAAPPEDDTPTLVRPAPDAPEVSRGAPAADLDDDPSQSFE